MRAEVEAYNRERPPFFPGLVRPVGAERTLNGYRQRAFRPLDWRKQVDEALHAFRTHSLILRVNDQQVEDFEDRIALTPETSITFFRRAQLFGG